MRDLNEELKTVASDILLDLLNEVVSYEEEHGSEYAEQLCMTILRVYTSSLVFQALTSRPNDKMSKKQVEQFVLATFNQCKVRLQESVAVGFQDAMTLYTGVPFEYYCVVKTVPHAINKEPC